MARSGVTFKLIAFAQHGILIGGIGFQVGDDLGGGEGIEGIPIVFALLPYFHSEAGMVHGACPSEFDPVGVQHFCAYSRHGCASLSILKPVGFAIALVFEEVLSADVIGANPKGVFLSQNKLGFYEPKNQAK